MACVRATALTSHCRKRPLASSSHCRSSTSTTIGRPLETDNQGGDGQSEPVLLLVGVELDARAGRLESEQLQDQPGVRLCGRAERREQARRSQARPFRLHPGRDAQQRAQDVEHRMQRRGVSVGEGACAQHPDAASRQRARNSWQSLLLPTPGGPEIESTRPRPMRAASNALSITPISTSRPERCDASPSARCQGARACKPIKRKTSTGSSNPLAACRPAGWHSKARRTRAQVPALRIRSRLTVRAAPCGSPDAGSRHRRRRRRGRAAPRRSRPNAGRSAPAGSPGSRRAACWIASAARAASKACPSRARGAPNKGHHAVAGGADQGAVEIAHCAAHRVDHRSQAAIACSGSRPRISSVEPTMSANRTVACFRSGSAAAS